MLRLNGPEMSLEIEDLVSRDPNQPYASFVAHISVT
jgi:hypothetical protein